MLQAIKERVLVDYFNQQIHKDVFKLLFIKNSLGGDMHCHEHLLVICLHASMTEVCRDVSELSIPSAQETVIGGWTRKERTQHDILTKWLPQEFDHG